MLGVVAAAISEVVTGQTVWSQIAGKYVDGEIVGFAFVQYIENIEIPNCRAVAKRNSLCFSKKPFFDLQPCGICCANKSDEKGGAGPQHSMQQQHLHGYCWLRREKAKDCWYAVTVSYTHLTLPTKA